MTAVFVHITVGARPEAERIARALVEERLAASANLIGGLASVYRWKGQVEEASEILLIAKTTAPLLDRLTERVRALHSYDCPSIAALPVSGGNRDYLDWIASETGSGSA